METKIQKRKLGNRGLEVSAICLGCMVFYFVIHSFLSSLPFLLGN